MGGATLLLPNNGTGNFSNGVTLGTNVTVNNPTGGEDALKVEQSTAVRMLKYGNWSRAYGVD